MVKCLNYVTFGSISAHTSARIWPTKPIVIIIMIMIIIMIIIIISLLTHKVEITIGECHREGGKIQASTSNNQVKRTQNTR